MKEQSINFSFLLSIINFASHIFWKFLSNPCFQFHHNNINKTVDATEFELLFDVNCHPISIPVCGSSILTYVCVKNGTLSMMSYHHLKILSTFNDEAYTLALVKQFIEQRNAD